MNYNIPPVKDIEKYPGFGFFPKDETLISFYISGKNSNQAKENWPILEINLCDFEPWELLGLPTVGCDRYRYFFHRPQYTDERNQSYKRKTKTGYWKSTGQPREIMGGGRKKSLVFYKKGPSRGSKAVRTGWIMQEYDNGGPYFIVRLQIKNDKTKKSKLRHQNVPANDIEEENQIVFHDSEVVLSGFEHQSPQEMMILAVRDKGETTGLMASVCNKKSSSTEFGGQLESPSTSYDLEDYNQHELTVNEVVPPHFVEQNWKSITVSNYDTNFSCETENQLSSNESEGECSTLITSPYNNFPNELSFDGEGILFSPLNYSDFGWIPDPAATNIDGSDRWNYLKC